MSFSSRVIFRTGLHLLFASILSLLSKGVYGQSFPMQNGSVATCSGTFYDSGGQSGDYGNNESFVYTICPGMTGAKSEVDFSQFNVESGLDELCIYDGNTIGGNLLGCYDNSVSLMGQLVQANDTNASGCLTFEFTSDGNTTFSGWEGTIGCSFPCQDVEAVQASVSPLPSGPDGELEVCKGDVVSFVGDADYPENDSLYHQSHSTSDFVWDFDDGTEMTGQNVTYSYSDPGIYNVELTVVDSNGCESGNDTGRTVVVAPPPDYKGTYPEHDTICPGMNNTLIGAASPDTIRETCTAPVGDTTALPDGVGVSYTSSVTVDCYNSGQTLNDVNELLNICMKMEHSFIGDLTITLTCPSGQSITLADPNNGSGAGEFLGEPIDDPAYPGVSGVGYQYCFNNNPTYGTWNVEAGNHSYSYTDGVGNTYTNQDHLPAGTYASEDTLTDLVGCDLNGDWEISITDHIAADDGTLFEWGIEFHDSILPDDREKAVGIDTTYWNSDPSIVSISGDTITVDPDSIGTNCFTYTSVDSFGCNYDTTVCFLVQNPEVDLSPDTTICIGGTATLFANASGGAPPYTYHWDQGLGTGQVQTVSPGTAEEYAVYTEDANGCTSSWDTVEVTYHGPLDLSVSGTRSICPGDTAQLVANASGGEGAPYDYTWSTGGKTAGEFVTPNSTTSYSVTVDDACETPPVEDSVEIEVNPLPAVSIDGYDLESCSPVEAKLINATPPADVGGDCVWDLGDGTEKVGCDTITHLYDEPGCYDVTLTVRSPDGCVDSTTRTDYVCARLHPDADFDVDPLSSNVQDPHFDFLNRTTGASSYEWTFGELGSSTEEHPSYSFPNDREGNYEVCLTATSAYGCEDRICRDVMVEGKFILYVPNAFTPDGDGVNDEFGPVVQGADESEYSFEVYDRWGELLFDTNDPNERWDGTVNSGSPKKSDVYIWRVVTENRYTGADIERTGEVTIVR